MRILFGILVLVLFGFTVPLTAQHPHSAPQIGSIPPMIRAIDSYTSPNIYRTWWRRVERCSGYRIPTAIKNNVQWRYVGADAFVIGVDTSAFVGLTVPWDNVIYVAFPRILDERLVEHEMLHFILYHHGKMGHIDAIFRRCNVNIPSN